MAAACSCQQNNEYPKLKADQLFEEIIEDSFTAVGDSGTAHEELNLTWVQPALLRRGQEWLEKHLASFVLAAIFYEFCTYPIARVSAVLQQGAHWQGSFPIARASST